MGLSSLRITSFDPKYANAFAALNVEWLEHFFVVEPHDKVMLEQCETFIIRKGGYIFFGLYHQEPVATFAFMHVSPGVYELGKMAVTSTYRGQGIGRRMLEFGLQFAKEQNWEKIILYSNTKLENAIHLYRQYGFTEIPLESDNPYQRSNIKMELCL